MFYAANSKTISSSWTHLDPSRVFSGQYWDEFGFTPYLVPNEAKVLMLGLARGGGIRPILSSSKNLSVTAIDLDSQLVSDCKTHFSHDFPEIRFEAIAIEAREFMSKTKTQFDCIWLDLYSESEYCPLYFDIQFIASLRQALKPNGVLLVNAYGLPNQFSPLKRKGLQAAHLKALSHEFSFTAAVPYRRNLTIVASMAEPQIYSCRPHGDLSLSDRQTFEGFKFRLQNLVPEKSDALVDTPNLSLRELNQQMIQLWPEVVKELIQIGVDITSVQEILRLLEDFEEGPKALSRAIGKSEMILTTFPILAASEIHLRTLKIEWLYDWFFANSDNLKSAHPQIYLSVWFTQLWAASLHPSGALVGQQESLWNWIQKECK